MDPQPNLPARLRNALADRNTIDRVALKVLKPDLAAALRPEA
jgi:hypothetical protein